jgi:outer membrane lipopolysaccharide assembly protein LptE/RlpB
VRSPIAGAAAVLSAAALVLAPLALTAAALAGCGYALVGRASNIPQDIESVYLPAFENRTQRPQVEQFLTRAVADELVKRGRFRLVNAEDGADARLSGSVVGFGSTPVAFDPDGRATEYEISITASVELRRLDSDEVVWSNSRYIYRENYAVDASATDFLDRETEAIEEAAERFAETMVSDLLLGF